MMVDALVMEMAEGASFIDRDVGIALHDIDLIVLVFCHFRVIRVVMALFRDLFAAATAAAIMLMGVAFVVVVMPAAAFVLVGVAFVVMVMPAGASVLVGVTFVVMPAAAAVIFFIFFVVCMLFGVMDGFLCLMAMAASAVMYMLFIVLFHGISPYL